MKSRYIAIAVVAMIAAVVLLSGCTSGPATNATIKATVMPTVAPTTVITSVPVSSVDAADLNATVGPLPDIRSGNNTSIINTSEGMREVPNTMLAGANNTTMPTAVVSPVVSPTAMP